MPQILIHDRPDRTGPAKVIVGYKDENGKVINTTKEIKRNEKTYVTDTELEVLTNSYEKPFIFVYPEVGNGGTDSSERSNSGSRGTEKSPGQGGKFGGASKGS